MEPAPVEAPRRTQRARQPRKNNPKYITGDELEKALREAKNPSPKQKKQQISAKYHKKINKGRGFIVITYVYLFF